MKTLLIPLTLLLVLPVEPAKILFLSFAVSRSHQNVYEPLLFELAHRGHNVTLVSPVPTGKMHPNFREITTPSTESHLVKHVQSVFEAQQSRWKSLFRISSPFLTGEKYASICRSAYKEPRVLELTQEHFDLVFLKNFLNECTYGLAHVLNTSTILTTTFPPFRWNAQAFGAYHPPSFVPRLTITYSDRMNFVQRVANFVTDASSSVMRQLLFVPKMEAVYRDVLGAHIPSVDEIERNASLILMNSDFTLTYPRPLMPGMVEVGGLHCRDPKPLPAEIEDFITSGDQHGFIYFSLGSIMKSPMMPSKHAEAFMTAFGKLKQKVIWKWEQLNSTTSIAVPPNVKLLSRWLPQQDILGHANILAFISHGGLLSMEEAVYHGVPILGIPMFGDQPWNVRQAERMGFGIQLDFYATADPSKISEALSTIMETRYRIRAKEMSRIFKDKMETPLERAVFLTEYVLRHKGATHLRSAARDLAWWQYHSYDVVAVLLLCLVVTLAAAVYVCRLLVNVLYCGYAHLKPQPCTKLPKAKAA